MTNYLVIQNQGLIQEEDLFLIGSSTKRDATDKIGMFGSGWKYALAYILRNNCNIKIFSGKNEIVIDTKLINHRDKVVSIITVNGKETSLTTSMGPKWNGWMAVRELVSNAIDEGEFKLNTIMSPTNFTPLGDNITTIYLECNNEINECLRNYESYFAFEREEECSNETATLYMKKSLSKMNIYRKGIRCYDSHVESMFDISFNNIDINESRLVEDSYDIRSLISKFIVDGELTANALEGILLLNNTYYIPHNFSDSTKFLVLELQNRGYEIITSKMEDNKKLLGIGDKYLCIRDNWFSKLESEGHVVNPFLKNSNQSDFILVESHDLPIMDIKSYLNNLGLNQFEILVGEWSSSWSTVGYHNGNYFLKNSSLESQSAKKIASLLLASTPSDAFLRIL